MVSFNNGTLISGANSPLKNFFKEFDVAIGTLENLLKMAVLNKRLDSSPK